ncbi:unnamed protein product [Protopolystoma xenopodis]|uniref:Uncharacterized protein n=1 Tax=Protopolystoma xenopodis TaxID=117903 RepID=A0A448XMF3_9PLAT|nr:unnamed protein product [Protopolystoma xenopodis]
MQNPIPVFTGIQIVSLMGCENRRLAAILAFGSHSGSPSNEPPITATTKVSDNSRFPLSDAVAMLNFVQITQARFQIQAPQRGGR